MRKTLITLLATGAAIAVSGGYACAQQSRLMTSEELIKAFSTPPAAPATQAGQQGSSEERSRSMRTRGNSNFATQPVDKLAAAPPPPPAPVSTVDMNKITFEYNQAELTAEGRKQLDEVADAHTKMVAARKNAVATRSVVQPVICESFTLVGHTDLVGGDDYNLNLSKRRASAAASYLRSRGVPVTRDDGEGKRRPAFNVAGPDERNRRVEVSCYQAATAQR